MLQFGKIPVGKAFTVRPGGYAVVFDEHRRLLAILERGKYFLPGGGIESGESAEEAVIRENIEETGITIRILREIGPANEFVYAPSKDAYFNKIGTFYLAQAVDTHIPAQAGKYPGAAWVPVDTFITTAAHKSHIWAVRQAITDSNQPPGRGRS